MSAKKLIIIIGLIILALLLGVLGSKMIGPTQRTDLPDVDDGSGLDVGADPDDDFPALEGRDVTGDEGEMVDGVRVLGPNDPTRVEDRDYFEGLEDMDGAVPAEAGRGNATEMDRMLERVERESRSSAGQTGNAGAANAGTQGSTTPPANKPAVERPSSELSDLLDEMEGNQ